MLEPRNYTIFLKQLYYFKGVRKKLHEYVRFCHKCQIVSLQKPRFIDVHQDIAKTPQDHLSIDLLGPCNTTSQGNIYILTAVCNLTGYLMTTQFRDKKTTSVANHWIADVMLIFQKYYIWTVVWNSNPNLWKTTPTTRYKENFHFP